ncbi:hypothetical protein [Cognatishimia sp. MH4019]|uniref:hypothetical protein n=1 Tax=Cognatishimia sp. MH4019 TaxID=2854030 RepID=UPI001CD21B0A|nr:hypothetical protein [Cognatishimia sp. MH4019]
MSKYQFSDAERYAVYSVHGQTCYLCGQPISLNSIHVDHILPEKLLDAPEELSQALSSLGLGSEFYLNSFENWMPACSSCNLKKRAAIFEPTPMMQLVLQRTVKLADLARRKAAEVVTERQLSRALNTIMRAKDLPEISEIQRDTIFKIAERFASDAQEIKKFRIENPSSDDDRIFTKTAPSFHATQLHTVVFESGAMRMVKAPHGIGFQPSDPNPHSSFYCGHCGQLGPWQGAKCMTCGYLDDGD